MEKSFRKASALGIFASGLVVGYAATLMSGRTNRWYVLLRDRMDQASLPKILPAIPEFDKEPLTIDVETQLGMDE